MVPLNTVTLRILNLLILIGLSPMSCVVLAQGTESPPLKVTIDSIQYEDADSYSLVIATSGASSHDILIGIIEEGFFIQTDSGWEQLQVNRFGKTDGDLLLSVDGIYTRTGSIRIPLALPNLFRTYEGDLSLMYKYVYSVRKADGIGATFRKTDEVYCWVSPGTSQWILREGM